MQRCQIWVQKGYVLVTLTQGGHTLGTYWGDFFFCDMAVFVCWEMSILHTEVILLITTNTCQLLK